MEWISIKEKLPEPNKTVLVTDGWDMCAALYWLPPRKWQFREEYFPEEYITHWLEYPDLPHEGRNTFDDVEITMKWRNNNGLL